MCNMKPAINETDFKRVTCSWCRKNEEMSAANSWQGNNWEAPVLDLVNVAATQDQQQHQVYLDGDRDVIMSDRDTCEYCRYRLLQTW